MRLASRGLRDLDGGVEKVADASERSQLRAQARRVYVKGVALGALATALALAIPRR